MMDRVMTELSYLWFKANGHQAEIEQERINCHHNFTQLGSHFGRHVWLTRKGAIQMRKGAARGDSGLDGNTERHRRRAGESDGVSLGSPRGRTTLLALRGTAAFTMDDMEKAMQGIEYRHSKELIAIMAVVYGATGYVSIGGLFLVWRGAARADRPRAHDL
jgi:tRNA-splicing ligase RtcB